MIKSLRNAMHEALKMKIRPTKGLMSTAEKAIVELITHGQGHLPPKDGAAIGIDLRSDEHTL